MILILRFFKQKGFFIFLFIPTGFRMLCSNVKPNITTYYLTPCCMCSQQHKVIRTVGAKSARAPPDFCISVSPISTREHIIPTTLLLAPLDFQTFLRPWVIRRGTSVCSQLSICHLPFQIPLSSVDEFLCKLLFYWCRINIKNANSWKVSFKSILCRQKTRAAKGIRKFLPQHNSALKLFFTSLWQKCVLFLRGILSPSF